VPVSLERSILDLMANYFVYLIIPATSALIGWLTNVLAIQMMFHPLEFVGKPPWLGWQGVIPANARKMAGIAVDTLVTNLLDTREIFAKLDPRQMVKAIERHVDQVLEQIITEVMLETAPTLWEMLPLGVKNWIYRQARSDAPEIIAQMGEDLKADLPQMLDMRQMMVDALAGDKALLNEVWQKGAASEMRFLKRSGFYFGFLFGIPSMLVWIYYGAWWTLPIGGFIVGYATNWLAIKMMFEPRKPVKVGFFVVQGVFLSRQKQASKFYAELVSRRLFTAERITQTILRGPASDQLFAIIERHVNRAIDTQAGIAKPYLVLGIGTQEFIRLKHDICDKLLEKAPTMDDAYAYVDRALDIETLLQAKLQSLSPEEFEGIIRPAYKQDEWKLIVVGGALGLAAGFLQLSILA
jgi:uncharacterized membrane protein YheB (UPF0754 family)